MGRVSRETGVAPEDLVRLLEAQSGRWGLAVGPQQMDALLGYARFLVSYDRANVTGAKTLSEAVLDHVLDSLSCCLVNALDPSGSLVDVGSGGGLPGLPLKLTLPDLDLTMLEATTKKARFLQEAIGQLRITGARVIAARAEDLGRDSNHREQYGLSTARAVASLPVLAEYCLPLVKLGGVCIAMKARLERHELEAGKKAARQLGGCVTQVLEIPFIPEIQAKQRQLVVMEKIQETPDCYPRRPGRPAKRPLGCYEQATSE